jgi:hypothetical protein
LLDHLRVVGPQAEDSEHAYAAKVVEFLIVSPAQI